MESSVIPSKEMEANQPANSESGQGHNQPEETGTEHVISVSVTLEERFRTVMVSDASVKEEDKEDKGDKPFMGQVPMFLLKKTEIQKYFQPSVLSIGPVHHGEKELEQGQQYKLQLTKLFIEKRKKKIPKEKVYDNILRQIESFKKCYDQQELLKFHGNDEDLAWMFFVDGCTSLQIFGMYVFLLLFPGHYMNIDSDQVKLMATDLILLDNQLPLGVLNLIVEALNWELGDLICGFTKEIMEMSLFTGWAKDPVIAETENHMLELIWMNFVKKGIVELSHKNKATPQQFRSVKDLQAAGIMLVPNNSSSSLRDISFERGIFFDKLKIPSFHVSEQGKSLVFNLIAFEMHPNFDKDRVITSYISFMNSLIATNEDVVELRKAGILINMLPNDEEVLKIFRDFTSSLKPYDDIFSLTKTQVIYYFTDRTSMTKGKWMSEAMQVYLSPWTTIAFVSATFLLILTIIQTILSILAYAQ